MGIKFVASVPGLLVCWRFYFRDGEVFRLEAWITFVTELSFPIAITFYLLHRIEGKLDVLNESIRMLPGEMKE